MENFDFWDWLALTLICLGVLVFFIAIVVVMQPPSCKELIKSQEEIRLQLERCKCKK